MTDSPYKTSEVPWIISGTSVGKAIEIHTLGISWVDPVKAYAQILDAVGTELGERFGFYWCSLEDFEVSLREKIGLPTHETLLIQASFKH